MSVKVSPGYCFFSQKEPYQVIICRKMNGTQKISETKICRNFLVLQIRVESSNEKVEGELHITQVVGLNSAPTPLFLQ